MIHTILLILLFVLNVNFAIFDDDINESQVFFD